MHPLSGRSWRRPSGTVTGTNAIRSAPNAWRIAASSQPPSTTPSRTRLKPCTSRSVAPAPRVQLRPSDSLLRRPHMRSVRPSGSNGSPGGHRQAGRGKPPRHRRDRLDEALPIADLAGDEAEEESARIGAARDALERETGMPVASARKALRGGELRKGLPPQARGVLAFRRRTVRVEERRGREARALQREVDPLPEDCLCKARRVAEEPHGPALERSGAIAHRDRIAEIADFPPVGERGMPREKRREVSADAAPPERGVDAGVEVIALAEDPAISARHGADLEQDAVGEAIEHLARGVHERLDRWRIVDDIAAEYARAHGARYAVGRK